jgi:hypothetical protein
MSHSIVVRYKELGEEKGENLFIYCLFKDTVSRSQHMALNYRIISE